VLLVLLTFFVISLLTNIINAIVPDICPFPQASWRSGSPRSRLRGGLDRAQRWLLGEAADQQCDVKFEEDG